MTKQTLHKPTPQTETPTPDRNPTPETTRPPNNTAEYNDVGYLTIGNTSTERSATRRAEPFSDLCTA